MAPYRSPDITLRLDWNGRVRTFATDLGVCVALSIIYAWYIAAPRHLDGSSVQKVLGGFSILWSWWQLAGSVSVVVGIAAGAARWEAGGRFLLAAGFGVQAICTLYVQHERGAPLVGVYVALGASFTIRGVTITRRIPVRAHPVSTQETRSGP